MQVILKITFIIIFIFANCNSYATTIEPQAYGAEKRLKYWRYYPNAVFKYTGFLNIPSYIEFEDGETVSNVSTAVEDKWSFETNGSKLFLKPISEDGDTIAIILTNKRTYFFEFHVKIAKNPFDPRLAFGVAFQYPKEQSNADGKTEETTVIKYATKSAPDLSKPQNYNFNYTIAGSDTIAPIKIFDDGQFTYLEFKDKNATLPAVFKVDSKGYEEIANFRIIGDYVILESISQILTLRHGSDIVCVFNESMKKSNNDFAMKKPVNSKDIK
ncbi:TrbG/VirB9 family P-type conjugative transfer protein [Candidatus Deianiraea vastatrix]|uniref:Type IV secretion system protein VirB9 n=1 Tax=Candidatus Deianiraea vastatrix TaxID=2163644 RepID=A0A5B8XC24_9RICK|nr:TrbG/VirB9 family P-type conjugative transfer protein [Candidatus Deianiraea vastatrix]QED22902.1 Type IV secretion system protein VirB9 precursor [Candidatus Deianiraea vastatrix]